MKTNTIHEMTRTGTKGDRYRCISAISCHFVDRLPDLRSLELLERKNGGYREAAY